MMLIDGKKIAIADTAQVSLHANIHVLNYNKGQVNWGLQTLLATAYLSSELIHMQISDSFPHRQA